MGRRKKSEVLDNNHNSMESKSRALVTTSSLSIRCIVCSAMFSEAQANLVNHCPSCKTKAAPCDVALDLSLTLNWREIKTLVQAASRWYDLNREAIGEDHWIALQTLISRLSTLRPPGGSALTFEQELQETLEALSEAAGADGVVRH